MNPADIIEILRGYAYNFDTESDLQNGIKTVLERNSIKVSSEETISQNSRLDLLIEGGIAVEVKIGGSRNDLVRQIHRYAQNPGVTAIIIVSPLSRHSQLPPEIGGKPIYVFNPATL